MISAAVVLGLVFFYTFVLGLCRAAGKETPPPPPPSPSGSPWH